MLPEAAFTSSWLPETLRFLMRSSRTATDCAVSLLDVAGTAGIFKTSFLNKTTNSQRERRRKQERTKAFYEGISRRGGGPRKKLRLKKTTQRPDRNLNFFCLYRRQKGKKETEDQTSFSRKEKKKKKKRENEEVGWEREEREREREEGRERRGDEEMKYLSPVVASSPPSGRKIFNRKRKKSFFFFGRSRTKPDQD